MPWPGLSPVLFLVLVSVKERKQRCQDVNQGNLE